MLKLIARTTLLATSLPSATADSFSNLTYAPSDPSASSSILDNFLNGGTVGFISLDDTSHDDDGPQNLCATSLDDARSKLCVGGEGVIPCVDARDCAFGGQACFLNVACVDDSTTTTTTTATATSSSGEDEGISHFVMLGTDSQGDEMMMANGDMMTTSTSSTLMASPDPESTFGYSSGSSSSSSSSGSSSESSPDTDAMSEFSTSSTSISSKIEEILTAIQETVDDELFLYETPLSEWIPSTVYRFEGFFEGLRVMHTVGVAGKKMFMGYNSPEEDFAGDGSLQDGETCPHCFMYGLVNIAAFLAQAMKETIRYDACDENSWDRVGSMEMYPISNSCGQLGQSYQDYHCSEEEKHMECPVDPDMTITAVTHAKWWGAPGPMICGPKSLYPQTGYWDYAYECNNPWATPPESCDVYEDQKAGKAINDEPYPNGAGRTDVEGCCWWGRGVIQTSGVCNFGKLNYYLGKRAFLDGRESRYPDIDFCRDPEIICTSEENKELKWIAGFFYWMDQVQPYDSGGWNYVAELKKFVNGGMTGDEFINSVSGIVNRGCHNPPCGTGDLDGGPERAENFNKILKALDFSFVDVAPTEPPRESPPAPLPTSMPVSVPSTLAPISVPDTISYLCGDGNQPTGESPPSMDMAFDYEMHSILDVAVSQALEEVKQSILSDLAVKLGCTETTQRMLQVSSGNIVGLVASRTDTPNPDAAGCVVEVDVDEPTVCTPTKGQITFFAAAGTSETDLQNMSEYLKSTIRDSMDSGRYESNTVKRVTWIGDRGVYLKEMNPPPTTIVQSEPTDTGIDWMKIALYSLAGVCAFLLCLLCMIIPSSRRKNPTHDEELAMVEYMNAHRESYYKGRSPQPQNAIQRRSEHLRAVQHGRPLQAPYSLENGTTTTSESDDDDDSYYRRRPSLYRKNSKGARRSPSPAHDIHHEIVALPSPPPAQRRESRRPSVSAPGPPAIIGETGQFFVKSAQTFEVNDVITPAYQNEPKRSVEATEYQHQQGGGVESDEEEDQVPITSRRRPNRKQVIEAKESHDPQANAERRQRQNRETWAGQALAANEMSKEERQRRIERARSNRISLA